MYRAVKYHRIDGVKKKSRHICCHNAVLLCWTLALVILMYSTTWLVAPCSYNLRPVNSTIYHRPRSIAFGSCQDNWIDHRAITMVNSDVFIYLGDNIYGDDGTEILNDWFPRHWLWYRHVLYNKLSCRTSFQQLVDRTPYVLSVWDDHDYGSDNDNHKNPIKQEARLSFLNFWRVPIHSERRAANAGGIFGSYRFEFDRQNTILILLLDMRWFNGITESEVLGVEQLDWIERELNKPPVPTLVVVASPLPFSNKCSNKFRGDRSRLASLLRPEKTVFISGDVHYAGIYRSDEGYLDVTSSPLAMTYPWTSPKKEAKGDHQNCGALSNNLFVDNFGYLDLETNTAFVHGADGSTLSYKWK